MNPPQENAGIADIGGCRGTGNGAAEDIQDIAVDQTKGNAVQGRFRADMAHQEGKGGPVIAYAVFTDAGYPFGKNELFKKIMNCHKDTPPQQNDRHMESRKPRSSTMAVLQ